MDEATARIAQGPRVLVMPGPAPRGGRTDLRWASGISNSQAISDAVSECARQLSHGLDDLSADLIVVFASPHYQPDYDLIPGVVLEQLSPDSDAVIIGCSAGGVIGAGREVEHAPGISIAAASLPGVKLAQFFIEDRDLPDPDAGPDRWIELIGVDAAEDPQFLLLADPLSIRGESLLMGLDFAYPGAVKVGGLASGAPRSGGHVLFLGDRTLGGGAVGVAMSGDVEIDTIVAQGCRPIGDPLQITGGGSNVVTGLDGRPPLAVLTELAEQMSDHDRTLARHSLFIGVVMDALTDAPRQGDFLIRNIVGIDRNTGAIGVAAQVHEGQTVQFHLRDAETSAGDLRAMLYGYDGGQTLPDGSGALMFSCLGRGSYLYGRPDHDTDMFRDRFGPVPLTGFFCNGEIGPVGGTSFLHGYTTSFGLVSPKTRG